MSGNPYATWILLIVQKSAHKLAFAGSIFTVALYSKANCAALSRA
jgi:hypothetical protein